MWIRRRLNLQTSKSYYEFQRFFDFESSSKLPLGCVSDSVFLVVLKSHLVILTCPSMIYCIIVPLITAGPTLIRSQCLFAKQFLDSFT